ncbi:flavin reductase family protein [Halotalea alkalilenta]|uniref:Flavin reductase like domain-containing protein n=1 Tax=Halotalea alkalilenta TaxID=376489 RepID=A0A172YC07_9GAMM|nr:flavin reductase family protein [Halotalea alkalilenta]ANF56642.1 hypothetical protein A5892_03495 [Halotalea alkalilenta]
MYNTNSKPRPSHAAAPPSGDAFVHAMRFAGTGVSLVTTDGEAGRFGATVSAMSSLSKAPPSLLVCLLSESRTARAIHANRHFCVNVLAAHQASLARGFASLPLEQRFATGVWHTLASGAPVLERAASCFDCRLARTVEHGTHTIFIGEVEALTTSGGAALYYHDGRFHIAGDVVEA